MPIAATIQSLNNMDKKFCRPSQMDYSNLEKIPDDVIENLKQEKYFERLFAYEFFHQFRNLVEKGKVDFGGAILHAEVPKEYQRCFEKGHGKIPDFILHVPSFRPNLAVLEFKLATNLGEIDYDFDKLLAFRKNDALKYENLIEVVIGNTKQLEKAVEFIKRYEKADGETVNIICFNTETWSSDHFEIGY